MGIFMDNQLVKVGQYFIYVSHFVLFISLIKVKLTRADGGPLEADDRVNRKGKKLHATASFEHADTKFSSS